MGPLGPSQAVEEVTRVIDLRYHVYSLAAVFFALALGIVIGTSFVGKPADHKQMLEISNRYERSLSAMKSELDVQQKSLHATREDLDRSDRVLRLLMPLALKDRLLYHNVAIVQTGDYDDLTSDVRTLLESAGAQITSVTKISPSFDFENRDAVAEVLSQINVQPAQRENKRTALLHIISDAVTTAKGMEKLPILEEKKVLTLAGDYTRWNKYVVIIGGSASKDTNRPEMVDNPLLDGLLEQNAVVVACEPLDATSSCIPSWKRMRIATVDNADRPAGQVALVCALGGEIAHFGQKRTADRFIPETLETRHE